jgi:hypothetical protein
MQWPAAPAELTTPANDLAPLPADKKNLTDLLENANSNYSEYYVLREKYQAWQQWYIEQKKIWDSVK